MKVEGPGSIRNSSSARPTGRSDSSLSAAFAKALYGDGDSGAPAVQGSQPAGVVNPLISLQEVEDSTSGPSRAKARAEEMLDRLEELRVAILSGAIPQSRLTALASAVQSQRAQVDDERLVAILDEIDLRAQVELAKLSPRD